MRTGKQRRVGRTSTKCVVLAVALAGSFVNLAAAQPAVDGNYAGLMTISEDLAANRVGVFGNRGAVRGENNGRLQPCPAGPFQKVLPIRNGQFSFVFNRALERPLSGSVAGDGSLSAAVPTARGGVRLTAKITGNDLVGTVGSAYCVYSLRLRRQL